MRKVSSYEFYTAAGSLNVHPQIVGSFPYESRWIFLDNPHGPLFGKTVDRIENGLIATDYFLNATRPTGGSNADA